MSSAPLILYEDNHLIAVQKRAGEIVHSDKTGDESMVEELKAFIKERDEKPGNVYLAAVHRIDRPVSGVLLFAKTSKALGRLGQQFKDGKVEKTYWAITKKQPPKPEGELTDFVGRSKKKNTAFIGKPGTPGAKKATLRYSLIGHLAKAFLWEITPLTGRHHQIRAQLGNIKRPIEGDVKYGFPEANEDLSIGLHAKRITIQHPVKKESLTIEAPIPDNKEWQKFRQFDTATAR